MAWSVTSLKVAGLELLVNGTYWIANDTYFALWQKNAADARMLQMAGRHPAYVGSTPKSRALPLLVHLEATSVAQRMTDYQALVAAIEAAAAAGLVPVEWTESAVVRRYWCHVDSVQPSQYMTRVVVATTTPDPDFEVV